LITNHVENLDDVTTNNSVMLYEKNLFKKYISMVREVYNHHLLRQTAKFYQNSKTKNSKIVQKMIFFF